MVTTSDGESGAISLENLIDDDTLQRASARGIEPDREAILQMVLSQGFTSGVLRPGAQGVGFTAESEKVIVPGTRLFLNKPKAVEIGWDLATAAALFSMTGSPVTSAVVSGFQRALRMMRLLSEDEADLAIVLAALSGGRPYDVSVSTAALENAYEEDRAKVRSLLTSMARRGVLVENQDGWRVVR